MFEVKVRSDHLGDIRQYDSAEFLEAYVKLSREGRVDRVPWSNILEISEKRST